MNLLKLLLARRKKDGDFYEFSDATQIRVMKKAEEKRQRRREKRLRDCLAGGYF